MQSERNLLLMHDARLEYLGNEYREECGEQGREHTIKRGEREIPFHQFVSDNNLAMDAMLYAARRDSARRARLLNNPPFQGEGKGGDGFSV
jgi:hypothetical protein